MESRRILLARRPRGELTEDIFKQDKISLPELRQGQILLKSVYFSVDPYMRNRMNDIPSYTAPFALHEPLNGDVVAEVVESEHPQWRTGDLLTGMLPWQDYMIHDGTGLLPIEDSTVSPTAYLGVLGLTGLTAYFGLLEIGKPQSSETVVVSGAAGAVGMVAGQLALNAGCRVVGITGSQEKASWLTEELGFDAAINYREHRAVRKPLKSACPDGIDVYFDNVGGDISDNVIYLLNNYSRIVLCGQIALYNQSKLSSGPRLQGRLLIRRVKMQGFIVHDFADQYEQARNKLGEWLKQGKLQNRETIVEGFDKIPTALMSLFAGENTGKLVVKV